MTQPVEPTRIASAAELKGEQLAELLSVVAEAPDFATASAFFLAQMADAGDAPRGVLLMLDVAEQIVRIVASVGFPGDPPRLSLSVEDQGHPLVASLLSLAPIGCSGGVARLGLPFDQWIALPLPQPQFRGAPALLAEARVREMQLPGCSIVLGPRARRRVGHAPSAVVVLEASPSAETTDALAHAALLAGPVLSRIASADASRDAASRLDQQHDLLTAIINSLPDPIVITDVGNNIVVSNRRAENLLANREIDSEGRRRAVEINNLLFTSFLSRAVMGGGVQASGQSRELNLVDPDEGTDLLFEVLAHPLSGAVGKDGSYLSVLRDVTDLRRAAGELERQVQRVRLAEYNATRERDRLNLILENVADPILVTDPESNIILMNAQAELLFEQDNTGPDPRGRSAAVRGNDTKFTTFISDFTISQATARREQMRLMHPDTGLELPIEVISGKILNQRGEPLAIVSVLHDLTKQVENERLYEELKTLNAELEDRIRAATADLAEQNARLQWQSRELEKANRLKSEFLASMSHELRTPINALIGYTALILDKIYGEITAKQENALKRIQASAQHLLALINDILDLAKIEAGKMPLHLEDVPVQQIIAEMREQIEPLVRKKNLDFVIGLPPDAPMMRTDRTKVKQILLNLLSNAVKFTHRGRIAVDVQVDDGFVVLLVSDTGIGIRPNDIDAIWEDFRQVDQSRTREFGGTGLGLSITRKLVDALGGSISLTSTYGDGTTFAVRLPIITVPGPGDEGTRPPTRIGAL